MYKKLVKLRNKKAFTLVEMLAVIAIVAVLVAVVVPIVGHSTTKARAATNAANLRAVEGELSTLRVSNPDLFLGAIEKLGEPWDTITNTTTGLNQALSSFGWWQTVKDGLGITATTNLINYNLCHFKAAANGDLTITGKGSDTYTLHGVPAAVAVSAGGSPGMEVAEGQEMTVWISETGIVATYETYGGAYTSEDFAIVAETGEFNGTPSGGDTAAALECAGGHKGPYTSNGESGHTCDHCGAKLEHNLIAGNCTSQGCDYACQHTSGTWTDSSDLGHVCSVCESVVTLKTHSYDKEAGTGVCTASGCGHKCSHKAAGLSLFTKSGDEYVCSNCGFKCSHKWTTYSDRCDECGFVRSHIHTNQWSSASESTCTKCGIIKKITPCGCEVGKTVSKKIPFVGTIESAGECGDCTHSHKAGEKCKDNIETWIDP